MSAEKNKELVRSLYRGFREGGSAAVLNNLTDDVVWETPGGSVVPFRGSYHGPKEVGEFFEKFSDALDISELAPRECIAEGDGVACLGHLRARVKNTGCTIDTDWLHLYRLRGDKIASQQAFVDTATGERAFRGEC